MSITANVYSSQYETNYANNTASISAVSTLALYPDLLPVGLAITPSGLQSGATATLVWNDTNSGSGAVTGSFQDFVTVSNLTTGALLASGSVSYDAAALGPIGAGLSAARQFAFKLRTAPPARGMRRPRSR